MTPVTGDKGTFLHWDFRMWKGEQRPSTWTTGDPSSLEITNEKGGWGTTATPRGVLFGRYATFKYTFKNSPMFWPTQKIREMYEFPLPLNIITEKYATLGPQSP